MARDIEAILEAQARSWDLRSKLADQGGEPARQALVHLSEGPWLSVSRQWGSGGVAVASEIARELEWPVYDRQILREIAEHTQTRETILSRVDGRAAAPLADYISSLIVGGPNPAGYLKEMVEVMVGLARQGQAVILGRGGNWFLDGRYGFRVRFVAPFEQRLTRVASEEGIDEAAARAKTRAQDDHRREFVRQVFGRDIDDPLGYDLVVNMAGLDREGAAQTVLVALRRKLGG